MKVKIAAFFAVAVSAHRVTVDETLTMDSSSSIQEELDLSTEQVAHLKEETEQGPGGHHGGPPHGGHHAQPGGHYGGPPHGGHHGQPPPGGQYGQPPPGQYGQPVPGGQYGQVQYSQASPGGPMAVHSPPPADVAAVPQFEINPDFYSQAQNVEDKFNGVKLPEYSSFDIMNPEKSVIAGLDMTQPQLFDIVEEAKTGKLANYRFYYLGTLAKPLQMPVQMYMHENERMEMNVMQSDMSGKKIGGWQSGQGGTGGKINNRAYMVGLNAKGKRDKKAVYYTMQQLKTLGVSSELKANKLGHLSKTISRAVVETFVLDAGKCPGKKTCGKRVMVAQGHKKGSWMNFFEGCEPFEGHRPPSSCNPVPIGSLTKLGHRHSMKAAQKVDSYRLSMSPGVDPWLMLNFVAFIDTSNNIEEKREQAMKALFGTGDGGKPKLKLFR